MNEPPSTFWDNLKTVGTLVSLKVLDDNCRPHHFIIPTKGNIGHCNKCNGERWFKSEGTTFNNAPKTAVQITAEQDMQSTDFSTLPI